jgi:uncharacterized glyoxalase superfamily protein PhnB
MTNRPTISLMLAVPGAREAADWYGRALGAVELWNLGSVIGLELDAFIQRAVAAGADGDRDPVRDHQMPWGTHRQGAFIDPYGHLWLVG